eukprot:scaffold40046_cov56-Phaeocystis_antarctica.AAC.1
MSAVGWGEAEASGRGRRESTEQVRQRIAYGAKGAGCAHGAPASAPARRSVKGREACRSSARGIGSERRLNLARLNLARLNFTGQMGWHAVVLMYQTIYDRKVATVLSLSLSTVH